MKKISVILALLLCSLLSVNAQNEEADESSSSSVDLGLDVGVEKKVSKKINVALDAEYRSRDWLNETDKVSISPSMEYKFLKHLKATVGGAFLYTNNETKQKYRSSGSLKWERPSYWAPRYRLFAALTGDVDLGRWNISLRERYQYTYRSEYTATRNYYTADGDFNYSEDDLRESKNYHALRSRLMVGYNIRKCPLDPFASVELTHDLDGFSLSKVRYTAGLDWKVSKQHIITFTYMYQNLKGDDGEADVNGSILSLGYKFKF